MTSLGREILRLFFRIPTLGIFILRLFFRILRLFFRSWVLLIVFQINEMRMRQIMKHKDVGLLNKTRATTSPWKTLTGTTC
jgi:hypothetical protein